MNTKVNDLRLYSQYKKQFSDKFHLKDSDFLIDVRTNNVLFDTEFELDGVKYHPYLSYENKNANTPKIIDISLNMDSGYMKDINYKSAYVESSKPSEVSINNVIEMCKNMMYEIKLIEECVKNWVENPNEKRFDFPYPSNNDFISGWCLDGDICRNGFVNGKHKSRQDSTEDKDFFEESKKLIDLLNTIPSIYAIGRNEEVRESSYHLKHVLERMDGKRLNTIGRYFSNGSAIAVLPHYVNDRYGLSKEAGVGYTGIQGPNCDIFLPKQLYYILEAIDQNVPEKK